MVIRESAEDYLETILVLKNRLGNVRSIDIAHELSFSKPSVSVAMKNLKTSNYITVDENGFINLTEAGQEKVYVYSVDGSPASKKALVEHTGGMMGIGAQSPINLGKKAVKIANAVLNGEDYEKETYEETFFINRDNVEMYGTDGWQ